MSQKSVESKARKAAPPNKPVFAVGQAPVGSTLPLNWRRWMLSRMVAHRSKASATRKMTTDKRVKVRRLLLLKREPIGTLLPWYGNTSATPPSTAVTNRNTTESTPKTIVGSLGYSQVTAPPFPVNWFAVGFLFSAMIPRTNARSPGNVSSSAKTPAWLNAILITKKLLLQQKTNNNKRQRKRRARQGIKKNRTRLLRLWTQVCARAHRTGAKGQIERRRPL